MTEFTWMVAVVFTPGLLWMVVVDVLTSKEEGRTDLTMVLRAFGFGVFSYVTYFLIRFLWSLRRGAVPLELHGAVPGASSLGGLGIQDIGLASVLAFALSILWSLAANRNWFLRAMRRFGITRRFTDHSVWDFTLHQGIPSVEYVNVRDFKEKLVYSGYVRAFSEGAGPRELLLDDAKVYSLETAEELFSVPLLYLSRDASALHVEYPFAEGANGKDVEDIVTKEESQDGKG